MQASSSLAQGPRGGAGLCQEGWQSSGPAARPGTAPAALALILLLCQGQRGGEGAGGGTEPRRRR